MSGYSLGRFNFVQWQGPRPALAKQQLREFTGPGKDGTAAQMQGVRGVPFTVQMTAVFASEYELRTAESTYRHLIGSAPQILLFEGVNYAFTYGTRYLVHDVVVRSAKRKARLIGPGYSLVGGWQLVTEFTLIPIAMGV